MKPKSEIIELKTLLKRNNYSYNDIIWFDDGTIDIISIKKKQEIRLLESEREAYCEDTMTRM